jgi:hypothetical protein
VDAYVGLGLPLAHSKFSRQWSGLMQCCCILAQSHLRLMNKRLRRVRYDSYGPCGPIIIS